MVLGFASLWMNGLVFLAGAVVILLAGPRLSRAADRIGRVTGIGQTLAGTLLLGASTSLPGLVVSLRTAAGGAANLAVANSLGGIAAQTLFIAFADVALRSDTLQHRDTLTASLTQSAVLVSLLALLLIAMLKPGYALFGWFHPVSPVVALGVVLGFRTIQETRERPRWRAQEAGDGEGDGADEESAGGGVDDSESGNDSGGDDDSGRGDGEQPEGGVEGDRSQSTWRLFGRYGVFVAAVGAGGFVISSAAGTIVSKTGFSPVVMGLTLTAVATSLPELVTAVSAIRRGAVALAIGDIVGGNAFDTVMVALTDFVYAKGSIYGAVTSNVPFVGAVALLMTGVLSVGLIRRDREEFTKIGAESYLLMGIYLLGILVVLFESVLSGG